MPERPRRSAPSGACADSVILVVGGRLSGKKPGAELVLDNSRCVFVSHVSALMVGERVRVKNSDATLHNAHGFLGKPTVFNLALPNRDQMIDITLAADQSRRDPGSLRRAPAHVGVDDRPRQSLLRGDRRATAATRIDGVPPGSYKLTMWHEGFRPRGRDKDGRSPTRSRAPPPKPSRSPPGRQPRSISSSNPRRGRMYKHIYVPVDNSDYSQPRHRPRRRARAGASARSSTGCHVYAARMHDYRFKQMEFTLPEEYLDEHGARAPAQDPRLASSPWACS